MPITRRSFFLGATAIAISAFGVAAYLIPPELAPAPVFAEDGIAIRGTDPVAYFTDSKPVPGNPAITHDWNGATWQFASTENRDRFAADPQAYAPQFGGFCAWAVAAKGQLFSTQPSNWAIVDGKLYLNYSDGVQATWNTDIPGFIAQGQARWPQILASQPS